ncbi:MAG: hypothetical protein A2315_10890 [Ignavibacteria bacterium RIFOXYB2_FULL_35_12]|nr:MAG: hypothetical protein A2058_03390 [Ignavibacteria bacterium GWA2_36_19]OGU61484.1 MAG: hypothetical protein A2X60_02075 [Ignavibacteria bacterium GWF2_35_20]OGU78546.1 MAG: hypothetical protein A2254_05965 [Ignavibacteria bacterium RIFOXYA2_FULL_35_9]OGU85516.1 MAG: hypothetical protein A3K31_05145 [Ignavibacteria bacterium RIFOXYA12_FULL_35_25]OGU90285.1 MAG: hypothetical protein A2492_09995 [Ignavibacteria bacterium RIFOXYC12_FULL_35_11]OGU96721.1 MAG: hypothetical protein A2347_05035
MNSPSKNVITISDILNSLFYWKDVYSLDLKKQLIIKESLDKAISDLLPINDLLIEPESFDIDENNRDH